LGLMIAGWGGRGEEPRRRQRQRRGRLPLPGDGRHGCHVRYGGRWPPRRKAEYLRRRREGPFLGRLLGLGSPAAREEMGWEGETETESREERVTRRSSPEIIYVGRRCVSRPWLNKPTGPVKSARSGSGLPDRFDQKPVKFKIKFKIACSTGLTGLPVGLTSNWPNSIFFFFFGLNSNARKVY